MTEGALTTDSPLVSIIIPAYNHARFLPEAVSSALAQDYPQVELIVLDDGSTDDTADVLASLGHGFYWETQSNIGQSRTLARGWDIARGSILGYLSADDVLQPNAVSVAVAALISRPDAVATYCDFSLIDPRSRVVRQVVLPDFSYEAMLSQVSCPVGPGAFFRHAAYLQSGPWNPNYRQMPDYDFWLRLGLMGTFIHLPQVLAAFRVHEGSQTYSVTTHERAAEPVAIVTNLLQRADAERFSPALMSQALSNANLVSAQLHLRAGRFFSAFSSLRTAASHSLGTILSLRAGRLLLNALFNRVFHRLLWSFRSIFPAKRG